MELGMGLELRGRVVARVRAGAGVGHLGARVQRC